MSQEVFITSLIVQVQPQTVFAVAKTLGEHEEVEVAHVEEATGKIITIVETSSLSAIQRHIDRINNIGGVLSTTMVYQHCESRSALDEVLA